MIIVLDTERAEAELVAGALTCPVCAGRLRPWSRAPARRVRQLKGSTEVRPRRVRCAECGRTQVLLPSWCLPRRADAVEVVGTALVARAAGHGHRRIAAALDRPIATVRRWLRIARGSHVHWLRAQGIDHAAQLTPETLNELTLQHNDLATALTALAAAVIAFDRRFARHVHHRWALIGAFTRGRLLLPAGPSG